MLHRAAHERALHRLGRALADSSRCRIVALLMDGAAYPSDIAVALDLPRANVSNHLARLRIEGFITRTSEGRRARYRLADILREGQLDALLMIL